MAERSKFQFRMRNLLWAVSLMSTSIGIGVAVRRVAVSREYIQHQLGYTAYAALVLTGLLACVVCFFVGIAYLYPPRS